MVTIHVKFIGKQWRIWDPILSQAESHWVCNIAKIKITDFFSEEYIYNWLWYPRWASSKVTRIRFAYCGLLSVHCATQHSLLFIMYWGPPLFYPVCFQLYSQIQLNSTSMLSAKLIKTFTIIELHRRSHRSAKASPVASFHSVSFALPALPLHLNASSAVYWRWQRITSSLLIFAAKSCLPIWLMPPRWCAPACYHTP